MPFTDRTPAQRRSLAHPGCAEGAGHRWVTDRSTHFVLRGGCSSHQDHTDTRRLRSHVGNDCYHSFGSILFPFLKKKKAPRSDTRWTVGVAPETGSAEALLSVSRPRPPLRTPQATAQPAPTPSCCYCCKGAGVRQATHAGTPGHWTAAVSWHRWLTGKLPPRPTAGRL